MPGKVVRQSAPETARLSATPHELRGESATGLQLLLVRNKRGALLYGPPVCQAGAPAPRAVMLHGAGGNAEHGLHLLRDYADSNSLILLAPESRKTTWDIIAKGRYGPDVSFINDCLLYVFDHYAVDPKHLALGGFSDGASYALSLGLSNGQLFTHIIAFSPGFMAPLIVEDHPRIFISHGAEDKVLPIGPCSRKIVPILKSEDFAVEYHEFEGPHTIPAGISRRAVEWFLPENHSL